LKSFYEAVFTKYVGYSRKVFMRQSLQNMWVILEPAKHLQSYLPLLRLILQNTQSNILVKCRAFVFMLILIIFTRLVFKQWVLIVYYSNGALLRHSVYVVAGSTKMLFWWTLLVAEPLTTLVLFGGAMPVSWECENADKNRDVSFNCALQFPVIFQVFFYV